MKELCTPNTENRKKTHRTMCPTPDQINKKKVNKIHRLTGRPQHR